jgi:hypothetical protein
MNTFSIFPFLIETGTGNCHHYAIVEYKRYGNLCAQQPVGPCDSIDLLKCDIWQLIEELMRYAKQAGVDKDRQLMVASPVGEFKGQMVVFSSPNVDLNEQMFLCEISDQLLLRDDLGKWLAAL